MGKGGTQRRGGIRLHGHRCGADTRPCTRGAARHGMGDFPAFWVGKTIKVSRRALLQWLDEVAVSHRDLSKAAAMVENAKRMSEERGRGRPRKRREAIA